MSCPGFDPVDFKRRVVAAIRAGRQVVIYVEDGTQPAHKYRDRPPLTESEALALIDRHKSTIFAIQLERGEVCLDFDGADAGQTRRELYSKAGLKATHTTKTPSDAYHDVFATPPGFEAINGVNKLADMGFESVDIITHRSSPLVWAGSYRPARPGKCAGMYSHIGGLNRFTLASDALLEMIKRPPEPVREYVEPKVFAGDMHPVCQTILEDDLNKLATCASGSRNVTLYSVSANLYAIAAAGEIPVARLESMLIEATKANGLLTDEKYTGVIGVKKTIASGRKRGEANPRCLASYRENYDRKRAGEA